MLGGALILSQEAALQARYSRQLSPLLFVPVRHELEEQSRNCFKQLNLFCWPRREKRLCLPLPHNVLAAQQQGQLCLFVRLKRSWLGTKVGKWGTWDTGKTEPGLPECRVFPLHNCTVLTKAHSALLSSALNTQNTHTAKEKGCPTLCKESGISSLSLGTQRLHSSPSGQQHFSAQSSGLFWRPEQSCSA